MEILNQGRADNYLHARNEILRLVGSPLTHSIILKINSLIMGTDCQYRKGFGAPPVIRDRRKVFLPADSELIDIHQEMNKLLDWYNSNVLILSSEILAARFHWGFVKIHPFDDGNGRTIRLLVTFILHKSYTEKQLRALERYFEENKNEYYEALEDEVRFYNGFEKVSPRWEIYFVNTIRQLKV